MAESLPPITYRIVSAWWGTQVVFRRWRYPNGSHAPGEVIYDATLLSRHVLRHYGRESEEWLAASVARDECVERGLLRDDQ